MYWSMAFEDLKARRLEKDHKKMVKEIYGEKAHEQEDFWHS
jgi:hypothetical protein